MCDIGILEEIDKVEAFKNLGDIYKINKLRFKALKYYKKALFTLEKQEGMKPSSEMVLALRSIINEIEETIKVLKH